MLDVFNIPTPQTANYQAFYYNGAGLSTTWVKPRGASMVRFLLIGAGGSGGNGSSAAGGGGGGSGSITSWIGAAMFVPDILNVLVGYSRPTSTAIGSGIYYVTGLGNYELLSTNGGSVGTTSAGGAGGSAMAANQFTASGIFTSIAGNAGGGGSSTTSGSGPTTSATTFLSGGGGGAGGAAGTGGNVVPNYGYQNLPATTAGGTVAGANGYFITQPILVGCGGAGGTTSTTVGTGGGRGGIGCGGGGSGEDGGSGGRGGDGAVFIWAW